jgi:hypothetical protein
MIRTGEELTEKLVKKAGDAEEKDADVFDLGEHYWLARPFYSAKLAQEVCERFEYHASEWRLSGTPLATAMWHAYRVYHGLDDDEEAPTVSLTEAGAEGEFLRLFVNHYRSLVRQRNALITADRLAWDVQVKTSDSEALRQVQLGQNICDHYADARGYALAFSEALDHTSVLASSFMAQGWDPNAGPRGEGEIWRVVLAPWECVQEKVRAHDDANWSIFIRWEDRWGWVEHFRTDNPTKAKKLVEIDPDVTELGRMLRTTRDDNEHAGDRIPVLYLYARPTRALPAGRLMITAGEDEDLILQDGPYPYGNELRVRRLCPAKFLGTEVPYSNTWPLLPVQEAHDIMNDTIVTRVDTFAVPNVAVPDGSDFEASDMGGANLLKLPMGSEMAPKELDFLRVPGEVPKERDSLVGAMEMLSGINATTRGNPGSNITSGAMAALMQQTAMQFNSDDERAYISFVEAVMTDMIAINQAHATEAQLISIAGKSQRYSVREFKRDDISLIQRITVKIGNAAMRTIGGRMEIANAMQDRGMFQDPREYLTFLKTGTYEPLFASAVDEMANIQAENEAMQRGEAPHVDLFDNDPIHIRNHRCLIDTQLRDDPAAVAVVHEHLKGHIKSWQLKTLEAPEILEAIGQPPLSASQAARMQAEQMQGRNPPPAQPGAPNQPIPGAEPQKAQPGPAPAPPGAQQPREKPMTPAAARPPRSQPQ